MKFLLVLLFTISAISSEAQNLKKLLSPTQLDSVDKDFTVYKKIDKTNSKQFDGFEGLIGVKKIENKPTYFFIGNAYRFGENREVITTMVSDSLGYLQKYYEVDPKDGWIFDCVYEFKRINGKLYRLETQKSFYGPNRLRKEGKRYLLVAEVGIGNQFLSKNEKFGKWTYYYSNGEIEKIEDHGEIK